MKKEAYAIIGAGPAGLASAFTFVEAGYNVDIYDAGDVVGGLSLSFELWGKTVELGPHFLEFITDPDVRSIIYSPFKDEFILYDRDSKIFLNQKLFKYPPNVFDIVSNIGLASTIKLAASALKVKFKINTKATTAEELSISAAGHYAHDLFVREYSEKIWGLPCKKLSPIYLTRLIGYSDSGFKLLSLLKKCIPSVATPCTHPKNGMAKVWNKLARSIEDCGGKFYLSQPIDHLVVDDKNIVNGIKLQNGEVRTYDHVIATIPILAFASILPGKNDEISKIMSTIQHRCVVSAYLELGSGSPFSEQCIFIYNKDIKVTKITNFSNFPRRGDDRDGNVILFEYWCTYGDEIWEASDNTLLSIIDQDLSLLREILPPTKVENLVVKRLRNIYPVPDLDYYEKIAQVKGIIKGYKGLNFFGRGASGHFNYSTAESMSDAIRISRNLISQMNQKKGSCK